VTVSTLYASTSFDGEFGLSLDIPIAMSAIFVPFIVDLDGRRRDIDD
jgi:hypothetical protein